MTRLDRLMGYLFDGAYQEASVLLGRKVPKREWPMWLRTRLRICHFLEALRHPLKHLKFLWIRRKVRLAEIRAFGENSGLFKSDD